MYIHLIALFNTAKSCTSNERPNSAIVRYTFVIRILLTLITSLAVQRG